MCSVQLLYVHILRTKCHLEESEIQPKKSWPILQSRHINISEYGDLKLRQKNNYTEVKVK